MKNYFTKEEKILCAFIALYDDSISIDDIENIRNRPESSINMKIRNYAALFDYKNIKRNPNINPLIGKTTGETGRMTDWEIIEPLTKIGKANLLNKCKEIIKENINNQKTEIEYLENIIKNLTETFKIIIKEELIKIVDLNNTEWAITTTKNKIRIHFGNFIVLAIENDKVWTAIDTDYIKELEKYDYWKWDNNDYPEYKKAGIKTKNGLFNGTIEQWNEIKKYHFSFLNKINEKGMKLNKRTKYSNDNRVIILIENDLTIPDYENKELSKIYVNNEEYIDLDNINETEKKSIIKTRIGQNIFREKLLKRHKKCQLCEIENEKLLIASHVKSWKESKNNERLDVDNGLLLCANHDALFDNHLISFDRNGIIKISEKIIADIKALNINDSMKINLSKEQNKYMEFHRIIFENINA